MVERRRHRPLVVARRGERSGLPVHGLRGEFVEIHGVLGVDEVIQREPPAVRQQFEDVVERDRDGRSVVRSSANGSGSPEVLSPVITRFTIT